MVGVSFLFYQEMSGSESIPDSDIGNKVVAHLLPLSREAVIASSTVVYVLLAVINILKNKYALFFNSTCYSIVIMDITQALLATLQQDANLRNQAENYLNGLEKQNLVCCNNFSSSSFS